MNGTSYERSENGWCRFDLDILILSRISKNIFWFPLLKIIAIQTTNVWCFPSLEDSINEFSFDFFNRKKLFIQNKSHISQWKHPRNIGCSKSSLIIIFNYYRQSHKAVPHTIYLKLSKVWETSVDMLSRVMLNSYTIRSSHFQNI
jgi:hypothetical protein